MNQIINRAKKLFETEKEFLRVLDEKADLNIDKIISLVSEAVSIEENLKLLIAEDDPTSLIIEDKDIRNTIKSVIKERGLKSIEAYYVLLEHIKSASPADSESRIDTLDFITNNWDNLFDIFHTTFDLNSYFQKKLILGPLITNSSVPLDLRNIFFELKEAFAYGLNKTCIALCRMVIENSFSDVLAKSQKYKDTLQLTKSAKKKPKFEFGLFENINIAETLNLIPSGIAEKSHEVRIMGNKVIHSNQDQNIKTEKIIKDTINIVESLYH